MPAQPDAPETDAPHEPQTATLNEPKEIAGDSSVVRTKSTEPGRVEQRPSTANRTQQIITALAVALIIAAMALMIYSVATGATDSAGIPDIAAPTTPASAWSAT